MIEIIPLNGSQRLQFESYDQLFDYITETENLKLLEKCPNVKEMNWSFTIYPPRQVAALYSHKDNPDAAIKEAYEEELPLIEICVGCYKNPSYTVYTPNVDIDYLKMKWCLDYCTYHDFLLKDHFEINKRWCSIYKEYSSYLFS